MIHAISFSQFFLLNPLGMENTQISWTFSDTQYPRGVPSGQKAVAATDAIWRKNGAKSWHLGFILKPEWSQFNIDTSGSSWNIGFNSVWEENLPSWTSTLILKPEQFQKESETPTCLKPLWFQNESEESTFSCYKATKNGLMALPVSFLVPGNIQLHLSIYMKISVKHIRVKRGPLF